MEIIWGQALIREKFYELPLPLVQEIFLKVSGGDNLQPFTSDDVKDEIVSTIIPRALKNKDRQLMRDCEKFLRHFGESYPNTLSGHWSVDDERPQNELHLRELYYHRMSDYGLAVVRSVGPYPDWLCLNEKGEFLYTEVEVWSDSFWLHEHDPSLCDLLVCWNHGDASFPFPVLELSTGSWHAASYQVERKPSHSARVNFSIPFGPKESDESGYRGLLNALFEHDQE